MNYFPTLTIKILVSSIFITSPFSIFLVQTYLPSTDLFKVESDKGSEGQFDTHLFEPYCLSFKYTIESLDSISVKRHYESVSVVEWNKKEA